MPNRSLLDKDIQKDLGSVDDVDLIPLESKQAILLLSDGRRRRRRRRTTTITTKIKFIISEIILLYV